MASSSGSANAASVDVMMCVRWDGFSNNLCAELPKFLRAQRFFDVTLVCDGERFRCHRLILASSSAFFQNLLLDTPSNNPVIFLPHSIRSWQMRMLVDFVYKGELTISKDRLASLLRTAEFLQIRGLVGLDTSAVLH